MLRSRLRNTKSKKQEYRGDQTGKLNSCCYEDWGEDRTIYAQDDAGSGDNWGKLDIAVDNQDSEGGGGSKLNTRHRKQLTTKVNLNLTQRTTFIHRHRLAEQKEHWGNKVQIIDFIKQ